MDKIKVGKIVIASAIILFGIGSCYRANALSRKNNIAEANTKAALDTTRTYLVGEVASLSRLVWQGEIDKDNLGEALGVSADSVVALETAIEDRGVEHIAAISALKFRIDSVTAENAEMNADLLALSRSGELFRVVAIDIDEGPIKGDIDLSIPADTTKPTDIEFISLKVDPFDVYYTLGCDGHNAVVMAQAPEWVNMTLVPGRVDPIVCNPKGPSFIGTLFKPDLGKAVWGGIGILVGWKFSTFP